MARFLETLLCALALNFIFFLVTVKLQWQTSWDFASRKYLWGFVSDVFGDCAAGGYKDEWDLRCVP